MRPRHFDVNEYSALLTTSTATISELRLLADSLPAILNDDSVAFVRALEAAEYAVLDRIFVLLSLIGKSSHRGGSITAWLARIT